MRELFVLVFVLAFAAIAHADTPVGLDFLSGTWDVRDGSGKMIGASVVEVQEAGAVLFERRTIGANKPQSLWLVNSESVGWKQLFLGPKGQVREFTQSSAPGVWPVVFGGEFVTQDGKATRFRMTMSRSSDTESRRVLELSRDGGANWTGVFDYTYVRR